MCPRAEIAKELASTRTRPSGSRSTGFSAAEIAKELASTRTAEGAVDYDGVRRRYLKQMSDYTKRNTIVYEATFNPPPGAGPSEVSISLDPDMDAFMQVVHGLPKDTPLDIILHSSGGEAETAEAIIDYLRGRFPGLRIIVPVAAMSAAAMMSMAADEIIMGAHSQLGPIDPQFTIHTNEGWRSAPAVAIIKQFKEAQEDLKQNPEHISSWYPVILTYAPALLQICKDASDLSKSIVAKWLEEYMFSNLVNSTHKAEQVADFLGNYDKFKSHSRRINRNELRKQGLIITDLESDQKLQDLVLSIHHSIKHLMNQTGVTKIVENQIGNTMMVRFVGAVMIPTAL